MRAIAIMSALVAVALPAPLYAQAAQQDAFVMVMGRDTFAVENFTRAADRLDAEMAGAAVGRIVYGATFGPAATITELTLSAWQPGAAADAAPAQQARVTVHGDSVVVVITTPAGAEHTQRFASQAGALPYVNPSFALTEQIVRRARALGGENVTVPLFMIQGGQTLPANVTWPTPDSVTVAIAGTLMRGALAADGRLLGVSIPAQNLTVTRSVGVPVAPPAIEPPDYAPPPDAPYTAEEVRVATPAGHTLAGTLTRPAGAARVPAVVMITGSGPQDRDQALPTLPGYRPFREIADTLGRRGIAVLRLDDRGFGASTGDFATATSADFAADIGAALAYLRARPDIDATRLGLVGHSEGGLIAPLVAATDTALAAIVIIAGPAQTGREIIAYQQREAIERSDAIPPASRDSALADAWQRLEELAATQPWLQHFLDYDPLPTARRVQRTPVLILHGATDRQVTVEQAEVLAAAFRAAGNADVTVHIFPAINHLLLADADGAPAGYSTLASRSVARAVLGTLADWAVARLR